jgi:hypothetical protein
MALYKAAWLMPSSFFYFCAGGQQMNEKPPLGLMPKDIHDMQRRADIIAAVVRYANAGMKIPMEWIEEYNALVRSR